MIEARHLSKWFGSKHAVDDVSFTVTKGEVLGFLGPNGAGKSTTMRMITGFIPPTSGTVKVGGHDICDDGLAARALIGYLPENAPLYPDMSVNAFLRFAAEVRGMWGKERDTAVARVIEMCFLQHVRHQTIETLSKGYKHRTCFAQSLLHDPPVLIMDEPTDGLDPNQKHEMRNLIKRMGETKVIILSTHILEEVDAVCSRAIIIDRGRLVANGTPAELRSKAPSAGSLALRVSGQKGSEVVQALQALAAAEKAFVLQESASSVQVRVAPRRNQGEALAGAVAELVLQKHWKCLELHPEEGRLDEVFRSITLSDTATAPTQPQAQEVKA